MMKKELQPVASIPHSTRAPKPLRARTTPCVYINTDPDRLATDAFHTKSDDDPVWRRVKTRPKQTFRINSGDVPVCGHVEMRLEQAFDTSDDVPVRLREILSGNEALRANSVEFPKLVYARVHSAQDTPGRP